MSEKKVVVSRERSRDYGGIVWPLLLITAGVLFLLDNLNVIDFDFWYAASRLWPIVLIAIGLDLLIGRRSLVASLFVAIITLGMLIGGFLWVGASGGRGEVVTESISQPLEGAESAEVSIEFGVGEITLGALPAGADELISGEIRLPERSMRLEQSFAVQNDVAVYRLRTVGSTGPEIFGSISEALRWQLQLNPDVPMDLSIDTGVGESRLDLRGLTLSSLDVDSGVGETTITLPGEGQLPVTIDGGVGELIVELPEGVAARIVSETGIGGTSVDEAFRQEGDVYVTDNYDGALDRIDLNISAGIGQVTVRTYSGR